MRAILLLGVFMIWCKLSAQITIVDSLQVGDFMRSYQLYIPSGVEDASGLPVVFNYHGLGSNAFQQAFYSAMNTPAEEDQFIVVYPQGWYDPFFETTFWNMGFDPWLEPENRIDDIAFTVALIEMLDAQYSIDQDKMYATGMSMGGMFSYWVACHLSDRIAAVASVAGAMTLATSNDCPTMRAVPLMQIHGSDDGTVPWDGATLHHSIPESIEYWVEHNDCPVNPVTDPIPDLDPDDGTVSLKQTYGPCIDESEVVLVWVDGAEHTWPGSTPALDIGVVSQDFSATDMIWEFFQQYSLQDFQSNTSIEEVEELVWNVFYSDQEINLQSQELISSSSVYNMNGQLVLQSQDKWTGSFSISTADLTKGIYFTEIITENGRRAVQSIFVQP